MSVSRIFAEDGLGFRSRPSADPEAIALVRDRRVRRVVQHAARTVPFYRRLFAEAKLDAREIRGAGDLAMIPSASKDELRAASLADRVSSGVDPERLFKLSTSGSTGEPMLILRTRLEEALVHAYQLRSQLLCGVPFRARRAKVGKSFQAGPLHKMGVLPMISIDAARREPASVLEELLEWRPDCLDIRPGVLELLVEAAERLGRKGWPWRWIVCGGEVLYPDARRRAEATFGAQVLERYGAHEAGQIAWACPHCGSMHTNDDSVAVEVVQQGQAVAPGERGEVLVTSLLSFAMPFLRFPLGDQVEQSPGPARSGCAFGLGTIGAVEGRELDNLSLGDGRSIPSYGVMAALRSVAGVNQLQVVQRSSCEILIRYVARSAESGDALGPQLLRSFHAAVPAPLEASAERVERIDPESSGKHRFVRSFAGQGGAIPSSQHTSDGASRR